MEIPGKKRYLVLLKRFIQELYAQGMTLADQELLTRRSRIQFDDQQANPAPIIPHEALSWIDRWTEFFGNDYYGDATGDVVNALRSSIAQGFSVDQTMKALGEHLGGKANEKRLEVITRMNATTAFNQGRLETFRQAGDFVQYVQFMAILDSRVTDICEARNGLIFRLDDPALAANTPPLHYNCRSIFSPVTQYDVEEMQKAGWRDEQGRGFGDLQKTTNLPDPAKGFGELGRVTLNPSKTVTEKPKTAIIEQRGIDVWIDELTPCLCDRKTGQIVDTECIKITKPAEIKKICKEQNWDFDWGKQWSRKEKNSEFYALTIKGETKTQGIIEVRIHQGATEVRLMESSPENRGENGKYKGVGGHLTAIAVKRSYEIDGNGYVFLDAKTALIDHYKKELGAKVMSGTRMYIDEAAGKRLHDIYFKEIK